MNYILEINAFYDWLETNQISDSSIVLWHALMHINNKTGWKKEFAVAISSIQNKTGLSKSSILRARNTLQQAGRINFNSRLGQQCAIYSLFAFHTEPQTIAQTIAQTGTQTIAQTIAQTVPILKLKETKLNIKKEGGISANAEPPPFKKNKLDASIFLSSDALPFKSENFIKKFETLLKTGKWQKKGESAVWLSIEKMKKYNEEFVIGLIERAIIGEWQGLFFSNTDDDFKKFLNQNNATGVKTHQPPSASGKQTNTSNIYAARIAASVAALTSGGTPNTGT
jgi:hypothetical protein